jgi:hypothetical protein
MSFQKLDGIDAWKRIVVLRKDEIRQNVRILKMGLHVNVRSSLGSLVTTYTDVYDRGTNMAGWSF